MRLRYLRLPELKPLEDIAIHFGYESVLGRACALHFVVGVNGSGKSRLMRALADIFLCMERGKAISFPVTLVYDLGPDVGDTYDTTENEGNTALALARHTIYLHRSEQGQTILADFDYITPTLPGNKQDWDALENSDWEHFDLTGYKLRTYYRGDNIPDSYLPTVLLAYTSGATAEWETLFAPPRTESEDILVTTFNGLNTDQERPPDWDAFKEDTHRRQQEASSNLEEENSGDNAAPYLNAEYESSRFSSIGIFIPPAALKLALCAVALDQAREDFQGITDEDAEQRFLTRIRLLLQEGRHMEGLRGILNEVDWLWPVTIGFRIAFHPERWPRTQTDQLKKLYKATTSVIREPAPGVGRHLLFDLRAMQESDREVTTAQALMEALNPAGDTVPTRFTVFKQLMILQQLGILQDVTIALRKHSVKDVLLYDWLSDGEQAFLGRMAFFHLLKDTDDALLLLDEAETHFNDYWKREMVDIIDSSLRDDSIEVLLSTHSSIALTDAFDTEIVLLAKDFTDGSIGIEETPIKSFGASPVDIMRDIFKAPETVGQRAAEFLDLMLILTLYAREVEAVWEVDTPGTTREMLENTSEFRSLREALAVRIPRAFRRDENPNIKIEDVLIRLLRSVHRYTRHITGKDVVIMTDALDALQKRLGPGYYNFEFRRRIQILQRDANAPSN